MSIIHLYHVTVQYIPLLDPKKSIFFHVGRLSTSALFNAFSMIKAVDREKDPNVDDRRLYMYTDMINKEALFTFLTDSIINRLISKDIE